MDKAQYTTLTQKIKAGTATPEEIQAVKDYEASLDTRPWYEKGSTVAEDKIAEIEQKKRMENPIEGASGDISRGNQGDNAVENPNALNTTEVTDVHQKELASAQTPENMNPDTFAPDSSIREEAEAKKSPEVQAVTEAAKPEKGDPPKVKAAKGKYNKSMMSIWDAYYNGEFGLDENGKPTEDAKRIAGYFTIDAIATLAKNLGRSMGNVAAQFSGGTIDQGHDTSKWEERRDKMFNTELQKESEGIDTFDNLLKGYQVDKAATVNDMLNDFNAKAKDPSLPETERRFYQVLAAELAGAGLDGNAQVATIGSGIWDDIKSKVFGKEDKK